MFVRFVLGLVLAATWAAADLHAAAHLAGTVTSDSAPVAHITVEATEYLGPNIVVVVSTVTDSEGNFDLKVAAGTWSIALNRDAAWSASLIYPRLPFTVNDGDSTGSIAYEVLAATGSSSILILDNLGFPLYETGYQINGAVSIGGIIYYSGFRQIGGRSSLPVVDGFWTVDLYLNDILPLLESETINVVGSPTITFPGAHFFQQPQDQQVRAGVSAVFSVVGEGGVFNSLQWQVSTNMGQSWSNLVNDDSYSGVTGISLTIAKATHAMNGNRYRLVGTFNNGGETISSDSARLYVYEAAQDFNGDDNSDLIWQNVKTGERYLWLMNGSTFASSAYLGTISPDWMIMAIGDLNGDGSEDLLWEDSVTGEAYVWLMNGTSYSSGVSLGTAPMGWQIAGMGDFNGDGWNDILWEQVATGERVIWLMNGTIYLGNASLMNSPPGEWRVGVVADFNGDQQPDIVFTNRRTGEYMFWLMNGVAPPYQYPGFSVPPTMQIAGAGDFNADGRTDLLWTNRGTGERTVVFHNGIAPIGTAVIANLSTDWVLNRSVARFAWPDFNGDGQCDLVWQNSSTGERLLWLMNGASWQASAELGIIPTEWSIAGTANFDYGGSPDILWQNAATGERVVWLMQGTTWSSSVNLGVVPTEWSLAGAGGFDQPWNPDLLWRNTSTGECALWIMSGGTYSATVSLGVVPLEWSIAGTGDLDGDGRPEILWQNLSTGDRAVWLMDGTNIKSAVSLGFVPTEWSIAGTGDFNADGDADLVWQNKSTGERVIWLMSGTNFLSSASLGVVPTEWSIRN